jgi:hypothetical protein
MKPFLSFPRVFHPIRECQRKEPDVIDTDTLDELFNVARKNVFCPLTISAPRRFLLCPFSRLKLLEGKPFLFILPPPFGAVVTI